MKNTLRLFTVFAILSAMQYVYAQPAQPAQPALPSLHHIVIKGQVTCDKIGVANVPITDGVTVVHTNDQGDYTLPSFSDKQLVYYTLPTDYDSPIVGGVPVFYKKIAAADSDSLVADFELKKSYQSQDQHVVIVWADPQVFEVEEFELLKAVVADVKATIATYAPTMPVHAISCGDNVFDRHDFFEPYKAILATIEVPFYQVIGNHDMDYNGRSHEGATASYSQNFGPVYYSFNRGKIHYVVLNDVFYYGFSYLYMGYLEEVQLRWLEQDLKDVVPGSTVVVAVHIPTTFGGAPKIPNHASLQRNAVMNNQALYQILAPYNTHFMAGHSHTQWNTIISPKMMEHTHVAASAAWWQGEIGLDGTPKGYTVYLADGDSLKWYFKGVGMPAESQFKAYPKGADPDHAQYIIANVFNHDPAWKVSWSENGQNMGEMEQYWGEDPAARQLYQPGKSKKHDWLSADSTHHLFRAKPTDSSAKISVSAIDRFGNRSEQELSKTDWQLVWSDEFDYTGLPDPTKWSYDTDGNATGWGNNEAQHYTAGNPQNAYVADGTLKIVAIREIAGIEGKNYSSARLVSKEKGDWRYGRFVIRAKLPTGIGTWPAIWMLPTDWTYGGWPASGEIDIMENVGYDPDTIVGSAHTQKYYHSIGTHKNGQIKCPTAYSQFHTYVLEWDAQEYRIFLDDEPFFTFKNEGTGSETWPFDQRFHLLLNLAIGGNWGGKMGIDDTKFPHTFEIDYVRVYQK